MYEDQFRGQVAIVTGAAGGIGEAVVSALCRAGASVAALDVDGDRLSALFGAHDDVPGTVTQFTADVRSAVEVEDTVAAVEERLGPVAFLVNCAGVLRAATAVELTERDWDDTLAVNARGVFLMSTAVARRMTPRRRGSIVTVASNAAGVPRVRMSAYAASKAAATAYTKTLGLELASSGIRCNVVAPGSTDTAMLRGLWGGGDGTSVSVAGVPTEYRVGIPLGRLTTVADVTNAVMFLLSDQAANVTMHDFYVDGGAALGR
ncbi:2,3-dihydro-2,3-dihydroxybenzoate dehydrogenase [Micromonospora antibiotica]|uniref:2,3-dihydro-2,3-dihydroxybenzoate dehydrogenase n=2 Tax=Actinomycetes TaxID=1760 RepID=A0ABS3V2B3_9ACTN|nr:2,3-dihydro-2,3-dihydroxybenzoate dehydrogenase [Micromonospora antibiotica]MBO4159742.1 2,3-dihydro-2,3-dihydroxybenzoate dehydrogenase [Micromonospora antibiotica]